MQPTTVRCSDEKVVCTKHVEKKNDTVYPDHNSNIDILRIVACLFVITIHTMTGDIVDTAINKQALLIHVIVADAVGIFFSITGFFAFRSELHFGKVLAKFIKKTATPTLIAGIVSQVLYGWVKSSSWDFKNTSFAFPDIAVIFNGIIQHKPGIWNNLCNIYWYVFDYAFLLLWFPVISIVSKNKNGKKVICAAVFWMFMMLSVENLLTVLKAEGINYSVYTYKPISVQLTFVCMGYLLYCSIDKIASRISLPICIMLYLGLIYLRYNLQFELYGLDASKKMFVRYDGALSLLTVFSLYLLIWKIRIKSSAVARGLQWVAGHTFFIYLIHYMIVTKAQKTHTLDKIRITINDYIPWCTTVIYDFIVVMMVFLISLLVAAVVKSCVECVSRWVKRNILIAIHVK